MTDLFPIITLKSLISHHIALIDRSDTYTTQEFALLFLKMEDYDNFEIKKSIQIIFRDSDIIFNVGENYVILLPRTNWNGAVELLSGLCKFLDQEFTDCIVTYPDDGKSAQEMIDSLKNVVYKHYEIALEF